jgi:hypothetical protein
MSSRISCGVALEHLNVPRKFCCTANPAPTDRQAKMSSGSNESSMSERSSRLVGKLVITLLGFAIIAIPLAGLTWEFISDLISAQLTARSALFGIPAMIALAVVLWLASRALAKLDSSMSSRSM